jgi:hypothetical protein
VRVFLIFKQDENSNIRLPFWGVTRGLSHPPLNPLI